MEIITFDLTLASTYQVLEEDPLIETLKMVHTGMTDMEKKAVQFKLQRIKQLPRRCEKVEYEAYTYIDGVRNGRPITAKTQGPDEWLNKLFNI